MTAVQVNRRGPVFDSGLCRCCGVTKKCRLLNHEYECLGHKEVYSDMFLDCFGLVLSNLDGEQEDRLVCATCVTRLRDACAFRRQVLSCEERLLRTSIQVHAEGEENNSLKLEMDIKVEPVTSPEDVDSQSVEVDYASDIGDYEDSIKKKALVKMSKKLKKMNGSKSLKSTKELKEKRACLKKLKKLGDDIKKFSESENVLLFKIKPTLDRPRDLDVDEKAHRNAITVVETSYVCPFYTSFSDYFCVYCREMFSDPEKLRQHTLSHNPSTFKKLDLNKSKKILIDITRIDCRLCAEKIDSVDIFKRHVTSVHGTFLYDVDNDFLKFRLTLSGLTCTECNMTFTFFHALKKHMAEHFGTCICDVCGAHYFEERMLGLHQKTHQKKDEESHPCKECGKIFKSKHSKDIHITTIHKKEPAYQCYKCDAVLFSYSLRHRHMIEVHGEQRKYPCEQCERSYDSRKSLREHNRRNHLKIFKHQCDLCDKRFYLPSRLKEHMVIHTGERNFRCEYCGKTYPRMRGLKVHLQSHITEKKYRCMVCNASFTQNCNLKNHMKRQNHNLEEGYRNS